MALFKFGYLNHGMANTQVAEQRNKTTFESMRWQRTSFGQYVKTAGMRSSIALQDPVFMRSPRINSSGSHDCISCSISLRHTFAHTHAVATWDNRCETPGA